MRVLDPRLSRDDDIVSLSYVPKCVFWPFNPMDTNANSYKFNSCFLNCCKLCTISSICSMRATACCSCGHFEAVVQVGPASPKQLKQAFQRVQQQKQRAPKFVLRDMHSFMLAMRSLLLCTARDDDVTQSNRRERQASHGFGQHGAAGCKADFQHTAHAFNLGPEQSRKEGCADTYRRGWRCPDVFECGGK